MRAFRFLIALVLVQPFTIAQAQDALPTIAMEGFGQQKAFGLVLGQSREEVAALTDGFAPIDHSLFRNAYMVSRLPNENLGLYYPYAIVSRLVYFDDLGRLWRVRLALVQASNAAFNPDDAFTVYYWLKAILGKDKAFVESVEQAPHVKRNLEACSMGEIWELAEPDSYAAAEAKARTLSFTQRVVFDIACVAIKKWRTRYSTQNVDYDLILGYGSYYETPVILSVAKGDPGDIRADQKIQRMLKPSAVKAEDDASK